MTWCVGEYELTLVHEAGLCDLEIGFALSVAGVAGRLKTACLSPRCELSSTCGVFDGIGEMEVLGLTECLLEQEKKNSLS